MKERHTRWRKNMTYQWRDKQKVEEKNLNMWREKQKQAERKEQVNGERKREK